MTPAEEAAFHKCVDALSVLVEECGSYKVGEFRKILRSGPMIEPSEKAVLNGREALAAADALEKEKENKK